MANRMNTTDRRKSRVRRSLKATARGRLRLTVYRSDKNIYAQVIDDRSGHTLASASTLDKDVRKSVKGGATQAAAEAIGKLIAERATKAGVEEIVFDRGAYRYHGRVKALAEAARAGGLKF